MPESTSDNDDGKNFEIAKRILSEKRIAKKKNLSKTTIEHQIVFFDFLRMFLRTWPIRLFGIKNSVNEQQNIFAEIVQAIQNDAKRDANLHPIMKGKRQPIPTRIQKQQIHVHKWLMIQF